MKKNLVFILVFIIVFVLTLIGIGVGCHFFTFKPTNVVIVPITDRNTSRKISQEDHCRLLTEKLFKSRETSDQEKIQDLFLRQCPETASVFPFEKAIWIYHDSKIDSATLVNGYVLFGDGMILKVNALDDLGLTLVQKDLSETNYILHNDVFFPDGKIITVSHPSWNGKVIISGKNFIRDNGSLAYILSQTDTQITVRWEQWGQETFELKNGIFVLKE